MLHQYKPVMLLMALVLVAAPGCATKKYVSKEVGAVNQKVETLSESVEQNQQRIQQVEEKNQAQDSQINQVDAKASEAGDLASSAKNDAQKALRGKLLYEVTLSNDKVSFGFNKAQLSDEDRAILDDLAQKIKADNRGLWLEIEGHTDSSGPEEFNERLGRERAEAVRDYLYEVQGIPLHRISVFSYGESQPIADNSTREGRARNRRVVIKVLE
jgi:outer membrane protein OmpA-like peptidoglycan-associated protein